MLQLVEVFRLDSIKESIQVHSMKRVDRRNLAEYLDYTVFSGDLKSLEASIAVEALWLVRYVMLKQQGHDVRGSLEQLGADFAKEIDVSTFEVRAGYFVDLLSQKRISLREFVPVALLQREEKKRFLIPNMNYNLCVCVRKRSKEGLLSDYPHYYSFTSEVKNFSPLFAIRDGENSDFVISRKEGNYDIYGKHYVGRIACNFWGTQFEVFDDGVDETQVDTNEVPTDFLPKRSLQMAIQYQSNILGEVPRVFTAHLTDGESGREVRLQNVPPVYSNERGCYVLNFYGRAQKASARNFQMVECGSEEGLAEDEIVFMHGKNSKDEFNVDYRSPLSQLQAFSISLAAIGKKRVVG